MWTIDAARKWPDATLVGFDLVNLQFPLNYLDPHVARRITWEHGNLYTIFCDHVTTAHCQVLPSLSTRLPFEDDTFDHVHVSHISKGVPEHKVESFRSFILSHQLMYHFAVELPLRGAFLDLKEFTTYL